MQFYNLILKNFSLLEFFFLYLWKIEPSLQAAILLFWLVLSCLFSRITKKFIKSGLGFGFFFFLFYSFTDKYNLNNSYANSAVMVHLNLFQFAGRSYSLEREREKKKRV